MNIEFPKVTPLELMRKLVGRGMLSSIICKTNLQFPKGTRPFGNNKAGTRPFASGSKT